MKLRSSGAERRVRHSASRFSEKAAGLAPLPDDDVRQRFAPRFERGSWQRFVIQWRHGIFEALKIIYSFVATASAGRAPANPARTRNKHPRDHAATAKCLSVPTTAKGLQYSPSNRACHKSHSINNIAFLRARIAGRVMVKFIAVRFNDSHTFRMSGNLRPENAVETANLFHTGSQARQWGRQNSRPPAFAHRVTSSSPPKSAPNENPNSATTGQPSPNSQPVRARISAINRLRRSFHAKERQSPPSKAPRCSRGQR